MKTPVFTGSNVALITPMHPDGTINYEQLANLFEFHIANGTDAITVCGTTGESAALSDAEHRKLIEFAVKTINGRVPVIAGTGSNDTNYAVSLSKHACEAGVDALLMVTPYYNKTSQTGLVKHYEYIADRVTKPIIVYNVPSRTGLCCTAATYKELSKHPMINGIKEASSNFSLIAETLHLCGDDMNIWSGNDDEIVPTIALGGKGVISVFANILPDKCHELVSAALGGDIKKAAKMQIDYVDLMHKLFIDVNPIPVKTAMALMGFEVGPLRLPLYKLADENKNILMQSMKAVGLL